MNQLILGVLFFQPILELHAHNSCHQKPIYFAGNISVTCAFSTYPKGYQQAIYNPKNCLTKTVKRTVKA